MAGGPLLRLTTFLGIYGVVFILGNSFIRFALLIHEFDLKIEWGSFLVLFMKGITWDCVALSYTLPLFILFVLIPNTVKMQNRLISIYFFFFIFFLQWQFIAEWRFWEEFNDRFNFIVVDYLIYTHEVIGNVLESYPITFYLVVAIFVSFIFVFLLRYILDKTYGKLNINKLQKTALVFLSFLIPVTVYLTPAASFPSYENNRLYDKIIRNGLVELFRAYWSNQLDYFSFYKTISDKILLERVKKNIPQLPIVADSKITEKKKLNVIIIVVESLGEKYISKELTPGLYNLLPSSMVFSPIYAVGTRTVRGIEALTLSIPPTPGASVVRREKLIPPFSLADTLVKENNYKATFLYGGFGLFDSMNNFFNKLGFTIIDRSSISKNKIHFANIWGVCDEDLLDRVIKEADHQKGPFFQFVLTTSNHRPYTYPEGRIDIPSGTSREGAIKYTDYAITQFIKKAHTRSWFSDTLIVITGDHGTGGRGIHDIAVPEYKIPLIVYSPKWIRPKNISILGSQIDILPTLFDLIGLNIHSPFFGRSLLRTKKNQERALLGTYQYLGLLKKQKLVVLMPKKKVKVYRFDVKKNELGEEEKNWDHNLELDAISYYQYSSLILSNSKKALKI